MELIPIEDKIYEIRGKRVMLDFDLAVLYQVETRVLNQSVKRNIERFPNDFMFQLTDTEWDSMLSQIVMTSQAKRPKKALPFAFTEHGVTMLSSVLRSDTAVKVSILVVRTFVAVRELLLNPPVDKVQALRDEMKNEMQQLRDYLEDVFTDYNDINEDTRIQLELINEALAKLEVKHAHVNRPRRPVGFIQHEV